MKNKDAGKIDIGLILLVIFITLKLMGVISWSWWWVLSPLWIVISLWLILATIVIVQAIKKIKRRR